MRKVRLRQGRMFRIPWNVKDSLSQDKPDSEE